MHQEKPLVKKESSNFDFTIGGYDAAEVYELIAIYISPLKNKKSNSKIIGIFKDDEEDVFKNVSHPVWEKIQKDLQTFFMQKYMRIIMVYDMKFVKYFEVRFS